MPPLGSAPRRVSPGVWKTAKGRTLTPEGGAYWENLFRTGHTDGRGHMRTPSVVQTLPVVIPSGEKVIQRSSPKRHVSSRDMWTKGKPAVLPRQGTPAVDPLDQFLNPKSWTTYQNITPAAASVIESLSPTTWFPHAGAALHGHGVNLPMIGLEAAGIFPFGRAARLGKAAEEAVQAVRTAPTAAEKVIGAMKPAKQTYAEQQSIRSEEKAARIKKGGEEFQVAGEGLAGHHALKAQLAGKYSAVPFNQLTHLDDEAINGLINFVHNETDLRLFDKTKLVDAIVNMREGKVPRPHEIKLIERAFGPEKALEAASTTPYHREIARLIGEVANVPRSLLASFDVSAPFRQGLVAAAHNPKVFAKNFGPMFHMLVSEKYFGQVMQEIAERPTFDKMVDAGVKLTDLGPLDTREEQFMSNLAEKIPLIGRIVRGSGRAYTGFLNRMRADLFDHLSTSLAEAARAQGISEDALHHDIARMVNWATGRGELGPLEGAAVPLNTLLFSPRLFASRIQTINPAFYASLNPLVRKQAMASTVKLVGAGMTVLTLAGLAGAKVVSDPRNSDFGKIKVGNTRFDIWGGHQQIARLIGQIVSGQIVSSTTGKAMRLKGGYSLSRQDIVKRFMEGKLAPTPSLINDWFRGTDFADKPFSWKNAVVQRSYPLIIQDAFDIYHGTGNPVLALGGYGIGAFGVGVQTYGPRKPKATGSPGRSGRGRSYYSGPTSTPTSSGSRGGGTSYYTP